MTLARSMMMNRLSSPKARAARACRHTCVRVRVGARVGVRVGAGVRARVRAG